MSLGGQTTETTTISRGFLNKDVSNFLEGGNRAATFTKEGLRSIEAPKMAEQTQTVTQTKKGLFGDLGPLTPAVVPMAAPLGVLPLKQSTTTTLGGADPNSFSSYSQEDIDRLSSLFTARIDQIMTRRRMPGREQTLIGRR